MVHAKTLHMILTEPEIDLATLRDVAVPTLVLQGDHDEVTVGHSRRWSPPFPTPGSPSYPGRTCCRSSRRRS